MIWLQTQEEQMLCARDSFGCMAMSQPGRWATVPTDTTSGILINSVKNEGCFAVLVSGGAGNGPLFGGYVSGELADAVVAGGSHAAPNAYALYEAGKFFGCDRDILLLYNNFAGDFLNNDMAQELLEIDGIKTASVLAKDDIATAIGESRDNRNGRCGIALLTRIAGWCRNHMLSLDETVEILSRASLGLNTISLHIDPETSEAVYGAGFSGEPGIETLSGISKKDMIFHAVDMLLADTPVSSDDRVILLVNRLRMMSHPDGYISGKTAYDYLSSKCEIDHFSVGGFSNITDRYGLDISILRADSFISSMFETPAPGDGFVI